MIISQRLKVFLVLSCLVLFLSLAGLVLTKPISQDEGVFLTIGKYINQGWLPYHDLVDHKPPAMYFLFAFLFTLFGTNVWVVKIALIVSTLGASVVVKKIGDNLQPGSGWCAAAVFLFLMTQFEGYFLIAEPFLLLPLLLSWWLLIRPNRSGRSLFLAGLCLIMTVMLKQTAVMSILPLLLLSRISAAKHKLVFVGGIISPLLIFGAYALFHGIMSEMWHQVVGLTLTSYPPERLSFVLPSLQPYFFWTLPVWMLLLFGFHRRIPAKKTLWAFMLWPLPFMFFRHYPHYWVQLLPFVALIAAAVLTDLRSPSLKLATLVFCLAIAGGKVGQDAISNFPKLRAQLKAANMLRHQPAEALLAENQFSGFYFLLPQKPLNKFLYITEVTDADGAEQQTIHDLQRGPTVLVLWPADPNYAYAKKLQSFWLKNSTDISTDTALGMRIAIYRPSTSQ